MPLPVEKIITGLGKTEEPLQNTELIELSNLTPDEMGVFARYWQSIEPERRRQVIDRLVELAEDNLELNFDAIFRYCLKDSDDIVRSRSIEGLWENEEASLIEPLIEMLEQDTSEEVRAAAALALGKFAELAEHGKLRDVHSSRVQEALLSAVKSSNLTDEVSRRALEAVAPISLPKVREAIKQAYASTVPGFKVSAIYAMGKSCDDVWLPVLLKELSSIDAEVRYEAAGACGELEDEEAVPYLINAVDDSDIDVRMAAIRALGRIGNEQAMGYLKECLESDNEAVRQAAEQALNDADPGEAPLSFM